LWFHGWRERKLEKKECEKKFEHERNDMGKKVMCFVRANTGSELVVIFWVGCMS